MIVCVCMFNFSLLPMNNPKFQYIRTQTPSIVVSNDCLAENTGEYIIQSPVKVDTTLLQNAHNDLDDGNINKLYVF